MNGVTGGTSSGADGNDTLRNIESIIGSQFDDVLTGNSENNGFNAGRGNDTLNGGAGIDTAFYSDATGSVTLTLRDDGAGFSSGADGNDTLVNIENLFGGEFNDTLTGNRLANSFLGRGGDDKIDGGGGFDTVNYFGPRSNYTITKVSPGTYTVTDKTGRDGTDTLTNVERLLFGLSDSVLLERGTTRTVPTDFPTIAAAAAASQPGDVINVLAGYSSPETTDILVNDLTINVAQAAFGQIVLTLAGTSTSLTATRCRQHHLIGNAADNVLIGNEGFNLFRGRLGNDYLIGTDRLATRWGCPSTTMPIYRNASGAVQVTLTDSAGTRRSNGRLLHRGRWQRHA